MGKRLGHTVPDEEESSGNKTKKLKKANTAVQELGAAPTTPALLEFSLFRGKADAELEDVFGKDAEYTSNTSETKTKETRGAIAAPSRPPPVKVPRASTLRVEQTEIEADDDSDDEQHDRQTNMQVEELVHESLRAGPSRTVSHQRYVPANETSEDRDRRTVFVGNLPVEVAKTKTAMRQLRSHLLTFAPGAKIESHRLRSLPFAAPTTARPKPADGEEATTSRAEREKERTAAWKQSRGDDVEGEAESKVFLDAKGKRKVAFITKDFHGTAATCNAYIVFAHSPPGRSANVRPILDPYEAATKVLSANGSTFMGRTIRVDSVKSSSSAQTSSRSTDRQTWLGGADPKRSIFIGGLDYESKEEELRALFERLVKEERGSREEGDGRWVESVRLIRDKDTQLGKGFGYVHFVDQQCVDEILALDPSKVKLNKRKIRPQRCKTGATAAVRPERGDSERSTERRTAGKGVDKAQSRQEKIRALSDGKPTTKSAPRGDPALGERIRSLSKDERKTVKAGDADRQARRLAKKNKTLSGRVGRDLERGAVKLGGREKQRSKGVVKSKKGRARSDNALAKMKGSRG